MSDLTEFLLARVAEDEAAADAADALGKIAGVITTSTCDEFAEHIARWHPARVLAECAAERAIVATMQTANDHAWQDGASGPVIEFLTERVLRFLALPHAAHPDYRPAWRP